MSLPVSMVNGCGVVLAHDANRDPVLARYSAASALLKSNLQGQIHGETSIIGSIGRGCPLWVEALSPQAN